MITLKNVGIVDVVNSRIIDNVNIRIREDRILDISRDEAAINDEHDVIDLQGCFAMPGLIDMHTHLIWSGGNDPVRTVEEEGLQVSLLRAASNARKTLEKGITCVRDIGSNDDVTLSLATAVNKGYLPGPRIVSCGCTIIMTGGHDPFWGKEADGKDEMVKAVRRQVYKGAKVIKISATGGVYGRQEGEEVGTAELTQEEIKAVCGEAHRFGLKVAAHAISEEGVWNCINAGVDTIEHGHFLAQDAMTVMKEKGMYWIPTIYVYRQIAEGKDLPEYAVEKAKKIVGIHRQAFGEALRLNLPFACGSDAGSPNTPHGSLLDEIEYMLEYGGEPFQVLQAATLTAARAIGMERDIGSLEVGKKADILVLNGNPIDSIDNIRDRRVVIKDGQIV